MSKKRESRDGCIMLVKTALYAKNMKITSNWGEEKASNGNLKNGKVEI